MSGPIQFDQSDEYDRGSEVPSGKDDATEPAKYGPLYDLPPEKAFQRAVELWKKEPWSSKVRAGQSKKNQWVRNGKRFVRFVADQDADSVRLVVPPGMEALPPVPNKVEEIVGNSISLLMADPPRPECEPSGDSAQARDAAQFATRYLMSIATESGLNTDGVLEAALDIAATYKSAFTEVCHDPTGGGLRPKTIEATADATTVEDATLGSGPITVKYVLPDGGLSATPEGAQLVFQPALSCVNLTSNQLRFLPRLCTGISDADGVVIARFQPLGKLKARYPDVKAMSADELWELVAWKTDDWKRLLPDGAEFDPPKKERDDDAMAGPEDDVEVCTITVYYKSCPLYPRGFYGVFGGGKHRLYKGTLVASLPQEEGSAEEPLDIPVAQMRWRTTAAKGDPYGETIVEDIAPMDEMRATQYASALEYLYRFSKPRWFLPMGTTVQPEDIADIERPIYFNPNGKPEFSPIPQYPPMGFELVDRLDRDIEGRSGIHGAALGQVAGSVRSAEQQKTLIEQANVSLTQLKDNATDYYERLHRIILQQSRAHIDSPTLMGYRGEDGAYQVWEFRNTDFKSTRHVRVRKGTFTLLAPTAKLDMIMQEQQAETLDPMEAARLRRDSVASLIGAQDSPHVLQIRRHLERWRRGPKQEQLGAQPETQMDPNTGEPAVDLMTGQPVMIDPVAQEAAGIFVLSPIHDEQMVAVLRHQELSRAVAEMEFYAHFPPAWQDALMQAYMHAKTAAGIVTVMEQQQQAAQQAQQQQAGQEQQAQAKQQEKKGDRQFQRERDTAKSQQAMEREAMSAAMQAQGA